jgi:hypothetical protein
MAWCGNARRRPLVRTGQTAWSFLGLCLSLAAAAFAEDAPPSFEHDILPILSKRGCNGGGCHGALAGKGGFRLSLFGYDPGSDHVAITRDLRGRRVDLASPGASLLVTKPTMTLPHKGGLRLEPDSDDYRTLAAWIAAGCPGPSASEKRLEAIALSPSIIVASEGGPRVSVTARYSDGTTRDVTAHARFTSTDEAICTVDQSGGLRIVGHGEAAVTAWYASQIAVARIVSPFPGEVPAGAFEPGPTGNLIDRQVLAQLATLRLPPSPPCDDATFLRRASLDTIGRIPSMEEVRRYLADKSPSKKERLVDLLLARPEFVDYWTYKWCDILLVSGSKLRPEAVKAYYGWVRDRVAENTPWDRIVREIVTARGSSLENGATNFFAVHQDPETMAENVSQAFLSLSINCAKCHNHPLEKWTNDQYYAFANLFARVRAKGWGGDARNGDGLRTLFVESTGDLLQPRTGRPQPPAPLDAPALDPHDPADRREALADWLTAPDNRQFARSIVNRVWANFFGIGLVEPVDDLRASNPASNEPLLEALADATIHHDFDLKSLMRLILLSDTYTRSSRVVGANRGDRRWFARAYPRRLMAEVLADAIVDVTGVPDSYTEIALNDGSSEKTSAYAAGTRALELADSAVKSRFLRTFGRNAREITCECERSNQPSLVQVLNLANGSTLNDKLAARSGWITQLLATGPAPAEIVTGAWLRCLGREPREEERKRFEELLAEAAKGSTADGSAFREAVEDLYWSLLTSREFLFQH